MKQIQATFAGFGGRACSLFSAFDSDSNILIVGVEADYRVDRKDGCLVITNNSEISRDSLFAEKDLQEAIQAYFLLKSGVAKDGKSARLAFSDRAARANPDQSIERDGMDSTGMRYRVSDGITCGQVAVLATCLYASRSVLIERTVKMAEQFKNFARGGILTI